MKAAIGVLAEAPVPGRCRSRLLAAHGADWVAGLSAAMLRDTLDGLLAIDAADYVVFAAPLPPAPGEEGDPDALATLSLDVLRRHAPSPWEIVAQRGDGPGERMEHALSVLLSRGASYAVLTTAEAPTFPTEPIETALADEALRSSVIVGPREDGAYYVIGTPRPLGPLLHDMPWDTPAVMEMTRRRCRELGVALHELPKWYDVDEPSDVLLLMEELRRHPERAPRTAQFIVTSG